MAPTVAPNVTASTESSTWLTPINKNYNITTSSPLIYPGYNNLSYNYPDYPDPNPEPYVYFYSGYAFYIVLFVIFVIIFPLVVIMSAMQRKRQENARRLVQQRQIARRQMEISIANNNLNTGNPGGDSSVFIETQNDMTILPKGMDLPPSYDELNYPTDMKQSGSLGASMMTITTDLECSNPNLAAALNEPPPDYIEPTASATTTTTTTTTTVVVNGTLPRI